MDPRSRLQLDADMARLADGDRSAFRPVFVALRPVVQAFCARALGSGADGDDAAQEALEKIFARASSFDRSRPAIAWALGIAAWECRTLRRRAQRARREPLERAASAPARGPSPEEEAIERELHAAALAALEGLSAADRETLRATLSGEPPADVAGAAFRKRRERALDRLREVWRRLYGAA